MSWHHQQRAPRPVFEPWKQGARCAECPLYLNGKVPVAPTGPEDATIAFVGEAPAKWEEIKGEVLVGPSGGKLNEMLYKLGVQRNTVRVFNAAQCLRGSTKVRLVDGTQKRIVDLVSARYDGEVECVDVATGQLTTGRVIGWYRNAKAGRAFKHVSSINAKGHWRGPIGSVVTEDHLVLTRDRGWVEAGLLRGTDLIGTGHSALVGSGREIVVGSLLGDGCVARGRNYLTIMHKAANEDYLRLKAQALGDLLPHVKRVTMANGKLGFHLRTLSTPWLGALSKPWYGPDAVRFVPRDLKLTELSIAVAFMDNGYMRHGRKQTVRAQAELATNRFGEDDVRFLAIRLKEDLGLESSVRYGSGWRINFGVEATSRLSWLIRRYVPESMQYKLLSEHRGFFDAHAYETEPASTFWDTPVVTDYEDDRTETVYCIDVEKHHNFVTTNAVVHNCRFEIPGEQGKRRYDVNAYMAWHRKQNRIRKQQGLSETPDPFTCCKPFVDTELKRLEAAARARGNPNGAVIVPMGNWALKVCSEIGKVAGKLGGIMRFRGSVLEAHV